MRYLVRSGCGWRMLPMHFRALADGLLAGSGDLARRFLFQTIHDMALMVDRERAGREASPIGGGDRQPVGEGSGKPKQGATTRARRSSGASATSPSIPTGGC